MSARVAPSREILIKALTRSRDGLLAAVAHCDRELERLRGPDHGFDTVPLAAVADALQVDGGQIDLEEAIAAKRNGEAKIRPPGLDSFKVKADAARKARRASDETVDRVLGAVKPAPGSSRREILDASGVANDETLRRCLVALVKAGQVVRTGPATTGARWVRVAPPAKPLYAPGAGRPPEAFQPAKPGAIVASKPGGKIDTAISPKPAQVDPKPPIFTRSSPACAKCGGPRGAGSQVCRKCYEAKADARDAALARERLAGPLVTGDALRSRLAALDKPDTVDKKVNSAAVSPPAPAPVHKPVERGDKVNGTPIVGALRAIALNVLAELRKRGPLSLEELHKRTEWPVHSLRTVLDALKAEGKVRPEASLYWAVPE